MDVFRPLHEDLASAEQHAKGVILAYQLEEQRLLREESAALEAAAMRAAEEGRQTDADEAREALVLVPEKPQRAAGTSMITRWHAEVVDFASLVLAVAAGDSSLSLLLPDQKALDKAAREKKGPSTIPGVRFVSETGLAASAR